MGTLQLLLIAWGVVTAVLICVLIYRSSVATHEEDQLFLDDAEAALANEQRAIVARLEKLRRPITVLTVVSGALLIVIAVLWLYQGLKSF